MDNIFVVLLGIVGIICVLKVVASLSKTLFYVVIALFIFNFFMKNGVLDSITSSVGNLI